MGNTRPPVATRRKKKKGRPSLLDLQRRSLRLQRLEQPQEETQQGNPKADDDLRHRHTATAPREAADDDDDDDDDDDNSGRPRREKKLRLVVRLPNNPSADSAGSGAESDDRRIVKIGSVGGEAQTERQTPASIATDCPQDHGTTTPLPDIKLLLFTLDRLQKKDTYGVFAEPVDPEELPDYHDIIEHPMDFSTIRKKLSSGAYSNLEQFEKDVFLISSNAMRYNSPDTIYYRQARSIQELAKKNFENIRQESDDNEPEPKPVRRGRPPTKNIFKKLGRPAGRTDSNLSTNARLANGGDNSDWINFSLDTARKRLDKTNLPELATNPFGLRNVEAHSLIGEQKSERNEGNSVKGILTKYSKKPVVIDENRRNTYNQPQALSSTSEPSVFTTFHGEMKQLIPVGLYMEHAYARSLARFAAKLGPVGWEVAAKRIEHALSPGTKFGRGWVVDNEAQKEAHPPLLNGFSHSQTGITPTTISASGSGYCPDEMADDLPLNTTPPETSSSMPNTLDSAEGTVRSNGSAFRSQSGVGIQGIWQKTSLLREQVAAMQTTSNGFNTSLGLIKPSQVGKEVRAPASSECLSSEATRMHTGAPEMVARTKSLKPMYHLNMDKMKSVADSSASSSSHSHLPDSSHDSNGTRRVLSPNTKMGFVPPDLNIGFQSPGSPVSGVILDSRNPNLSLQL